MQEQITIAIGVVLNDNGQLLITKRLEADIPDANEKWDLIGGIVDFGETPPQALAREVKEEAGIVVNIFALLPKIFSSTWKKTNGDELHVTIISYLCNIVGGSLKEKSDDSKIAEMKFIDPKELKDYETLPTVKEIVSLAMNI